jgi:two-component system, chemotaxis family, sensor kinase CheA
MSLDLSQFHAAFFDEGLDCLDQAEEALLIFEKREGVSHAIVTAGIDAAFRAVHSVKGSAGTLGLRQIAEFSHELEGVMELHRSRWSQFQESPSDQHVSIILSALDLLRSMLLSAQQKQGEVSASRLAAITRKLSQIQSDLSIANQTQSEAPTSAIEVEKVSLEQTKRFSTPYVYQYEIFFCPYSEMMNCGIWIP